MNDYEEAMSKIIAGEPYEPPQCPRCDSVDTVPILYGYPAPEMYAAMNAGKVAIGGCLVWSGQPLWYCKTCGHKWGTD
jgi:hypothetical protein